MTKWNNQIKWIWMGQVRVMVPWEWTLDQKVSLSNRWACSDLTWTWSNQWNSIVNQEPMSLNEAWPSKWIMHTWIIVNPVKLGFGVDEVSWCRFTRLKHTQGWRLGLTSRPRSKLKASNQMITCTSPRGSEN